MLERCLESREHQPGRTVDSKPMTCAPALRRLAAVALASIALGAPEWTHADQADSRYTESTRQILKANKLKGVAKKDPAEAIRRLDELRASGTADAVSIAIAQVALNAAAKSAPGEAAGLYLRAAAETDSAGLDQAREGGGVSLGLQDTAVEGLVRVLQQAGSATPGEPRFVEGPLGGYELTWVDAETHWTRDSHRFEPASKVPRKKKVRDVGTQDGLGVPVLALRREQGEEGMERERGLFETYRWVYPLTAVLELGPDSDAGPRAATLRLVDPRLAMTHDIGGVEYPLSVDIGAQYREVVRGTDAIFAKGGILHAGKYMSLTSLYLLEPPRVGKIPVVLVHGLNSSPLTWSAALQAFVEDKKLRDNFQVWLFAYPTALSFPYSSMLLRRSLDQAVDELEALDSHPNHSRVLLIGHSMGGLLARMQVTDSGPALWDSIFRVPPELLEHPPEEIDQITEVLFVEPSPYIERVVFCSTPHRGSRFAANLAGVVGAGIVGLPDNLAESSRAILSQPDDLTEEGAEFEKMPDSIQSLRPDHPLILTLNDLPIAPGITYHSIVGDRGKGDTPDSSDGVVAYRSSHLDDAASEVVIPSGHGTHSHEEGIRELVRILYLHLEN